MERCCSIVFEGAGFSFILSRGVLIDDNVNISLSQSTCVQQAGDILEGDLHRLFVGFLLGRHSRLLLLPAERDLCYLT